MGSFRFVFPMSFACAPCCSPPLPLHTSNHIPSVAHPTPTRRRPSHHVPSTTHTVSSPATALALSILTTSRFSVFFPPYSYYNGPGTLSVPLPLQAHNPAQNPVSISSNTYLFLCGQPHVYLLPLPRSVHFFRGYFYFHVCFRCAIFTDMSTSLPFD
jgi:hypothetical protein